MYAIYSGKGSDRRAENNDWKLELAVDDLLREHHDTVPLPKIPCTIHHRDSFSTISTRESIPDNSNLCRIKRDGRCDEFVPIEISYPSSPSFLRHDSSLSSTSSNHRRPLLQKPSKLLPDSRSVFGYYEDDEDDLDDIVFVPAKEDLASESSSMKVVRTISRRLSSVVERKEQGSIAPSNNTSKSHTSNRRDRPHQRLRRQPSIGIDSLGPPPLRRGMHQLSIRINRRFEI